MMRALFVPGYRYPASLSEPITSGDLRFTFNMSRALTRAGHVVTVLSRWRDGDRFDADFDGVRVLRYRSELGSILSTSFDLSLRRAKLFKELIDESHVAFVNSPLSFELPVRSETPICYVASGLEDVKNYGRSASEVLGRLAIRTVREPLKKATWRRAQFVNTTAAGEMQTLLEWGVTPEKVVSIGPSVELQRFVPNESAKTPEVRRSLGLAEHGRLILCVARFAPAKGLLQTLDAFAELRTRVSDVRLVMVGVDQGHSSGYLNSVQGRVAEIGLDDHVQIKLDVPEHVLPSYYSASHVTSVFSQMYDPLPTVIIESMACGTPVVSSSHVTRTQFIQDGYNGLFVEEGNAASWCEAVLSLLDCGDLSRRISANGLKTVTKRFDADHVASSLLSLFLDRPSTDALEPTTPSQSP